MSSSSVVVMKRTEVEPVYEWYVDLDEYLGPQSNVSAAHTRCQGIVCIMGLCVQVCGSHSCRACA